MDWDICNLYDVHYSQEKCICEILTLTYVHYSIWDMENKHIQKLLSNYNLVQFEKLVYKDRDDLE